ERIRAGTAARRRRVSSVVAIFLHYNNDEERSRMKHGFPGFPEEGMTFLRALKKNNRRDWFQPRKAVYEDKVRAPMLELVAALQREMMEFAPDYVGDPKKAVYRIYRDTRFSGNKTPYKTNIAAVFPRRGLEKHGGAGFYFSVSPGEVAVGGGVYMPPPEALLAIRRHLESHHARFREIARARAIRSLLGDVQGEQLTRVPKGFAVDHPAADLVKFKQVLLYVEMEKAPVTNAKLYAEIARRFRAMTPFIEFLNEPLERNAQSGK
ncbi:MAG: DUF2461 domain-containing protein, partial [Terriglobia bacterium]